MGYQEHETRDHLACHGFDLQLSRDGTKTATTGAPQDLCRKCWDGFCHDRQNITGLWRTSDLTDVLFNAKVALITSIIKQVNLKLEFIDEYKNVIPSVQIKKTDTALITSFLFTF